MVSGPDFLRSSRFRDYGWIRAQWSISEDQRWLCVTDAVTDALDWQWLSDMSRVTLQVTCTFQFTRTLFLGSSLDLPHHSWASTSGSSLALQIPKRAKEGKHELLYHPKTFLNQETTSSKPVTTQTPLAKQEKCWCSNIFILHIHQKV